MTYIFITMKSLMAVICAIVMSAFGMIPGEVLPFKALKDDIQLNAVLISDVHTDYREYIGQSIFAVGLQKLKVSCTPVDAVVVSGDLTNYGDEKSLERFYKILSESSPVDKANIIAAVGNHDIGHVTDLGITQDEAREYFARLTNEYLGTEIDRVYYSREIKGYRFIALGDEAENSWDWPEITQEQLDFLDSELALGTAEGKPVFVVCHWPINGTNGQETVWDDGGMDDCSDAVRAVLEKYADKNVFYISGHLHEGLNSAVVTGMFDVRNVETVNGVNYVNLPSYGLVNRYGIPWPCTGFQMEVYEDEVIFRARNYLTANWYVSYNRSVELV